MAQVEKIKALIREMMDQEMENYKDAVSLGTQDETSAPVVYTMLQVLLAKIEKMPSVWHDSNTVPVAPDKNHLWVVVSFKNGDIRTCFIDTLVTWQRVQREAIDCWAYREDLLEL